MSAVEDPPFPRDAPIASDPLAAEERGPTSIPADRLPLAVVERDADGVVIGWNVAAEQLFGYTAAEALGARATPEGHSPGETPTLARLLAEIPAHGDSARRRQAHLTKDGSRVTCEWVATSLGGPQEGGERVASLGLDVTARARAEETLERSNDLMRAIIDAAPTAIIGLDLDGKVHTVWNRAAEKLLGWSADEAMGQFLPSVPRDKVAEFEGFRRRVRSGQSLLGVDVTRQRKDGSPIEYSIYTSPLHDETGQISGNVAVLVDMTDRKRIERESANLLAQLRHAQKMEAVGRLAGGIAHDFNNMLSVIIGYAELMREALSDDHPLLPDLLEIRRAADRSREMTGQLLALSRKQTISPRLVDLNDIVSRAQRALTRLIGEDIELEFLPVPDLWRVKVDASQIEQILMNLVVNARDAMPGGGRLTVETANVVFDDAYCRAHLGCTPGRYAMLSVTDDGAGMDKETLSHVFEPFFTTKIPGKGTGLGLAMVYGIVRQNEGFINIYSEVGKGTVIKLYLPQSAEDEEHEELKSALVLRDTGTVLLVEDEASVREMVARMLKSVGYSVIVARTPEEALAICEDSTNAIDFVLTDVVMPGMNGKELSEKIRGIRPQVVTVYMSGYTANVIAHRGILDEGVYLLAKPFTVSELARKLREASGRAD